MNAPLPLFGAAVAAGDKTANTLAAARALAPQLNRSRPLDRRLVAATLTTSFGGSDAEGAWIWRDAYDAIEAALVLQLRRLAPQLARLEDAPAEIVALLSNLTALTLTHSRRSEEQVALDQFSTPPALAAAAVAAAQVRSGDRVLEPSAGTGLMAIIAEACGAELSLNELAPHRCALLEALFAPAIPTRHDAVHLKDLLPLSGSFDAVLVNPPFQHLERHLQAALDCLAVGGRMSAIVPARLFDDRAALHSLRSRGELVAAFAFPPQAFAKHGTSVDVGLLVVDRSDSVGAAAPSVRLFDTAAEAAEAATTLPPRPTARPRVFRPASPSALVTPRARALAGPVARLSFLDSAAPVAYTAVPWRGQGRDVGLYQAYQVSRIEAQDAQPHPSPLVESAAMASVPPPAPSYRPVLPARLVADGQISDAQLETVIYAGEAHSRVLPGWWTLADAPHQLALAREDVPGAFQLRCGFMLGDGTGCGKGRQAAAVIADNMAQGRLRALWISKNDHLLEDARRDWTAIGGSKGARGPKKASQQGMAGLALQNRLPKARVMYVSATGATTPENLAYAARLGLWGGPEAPFPTREAFMEAVDKGGVAVMELIARELKALGLYVARSLSFEGVEYEAVRHALTATDIEIWNAWADAYQVIHQNLRAALEAVGVTEDGKAKNGQAASAVMSAFEGAKLRFFGALLSGLKAPTLVTSVREDLAKDRSAVIQIVSTHEAVMERRLAEIPPEEWNNLAVDLTPKDQALDYLMGAFPVTAMESIEDEDGAVTLRPLMVDGRPVLSQEALRLREALVTELACLPAVPGVLDALLDAFGPDLVAEITGRSRRIVR